MRSMLKAGVLAVASLVASGGWAPEPKPIPTRWQLDATIGELRLTTIEVPGVGPQSYFYLTYVITNNSGQDLLFAPAFEMCFEDGRTIRSGRGVPAYATQQILSRLDNPYLVDQNTIIDSLLQGEANTKEGLAIWVAPTLKAETLELYLAGFSGETATLTLPQPEGEAKKVVLRKSLRLRYMSPGEMTSTGDEPFVEVERRWIMR